MGDSASFIVKEFDASDGYRWRYRNYPVPENARIRGRVIFLHGIQSHAGWYEHSSAALAAAGLEVDFLDRRGAGMNESARGDTSGFRRLLRDVAEFLDATRAPATERPLFLAGISWGGKLAAALPAYHACNLAGLILLCPGFFPQVGFSRRDRLRIAWSRLVAPRRMFPVPLNEPELFTASPRWQEFIRQDPRSLREATARFFFESVRLDGYLRMVHRRINTPVLLLLAEKDRIIRNQPTRSFIESFASADKKCIEYPEAHHTLEFEPHPERFIRELQDWLSQHTPIS